MTGATIGSEAVANDILGLPNPWAAAYNPARFMLSLSAAYKVSWCQRLLACQPICFAICSLQAASGWPAAYNPSCFMSAGFYVVSGCALSSSLSA